MVLGRDLDARAAGKPTRVPVVAPMRDVAGDAEREDPDRQQVLLSTTDERRDVQAQGPRIVLDMRHATIDPHLPAREQSLTVQPDQAGFGNRETPPEMQVFALMALAAVRERSVGLRPQCIVVIQGLPALHRRTDEERLIHHRGHGQGYLGVNVPVRLVGLHPDVADLPTPRAGDHQSFHGRDRDHRMGLKRLSPIHLHICAARLDIERHFATHVEPTIGRQVGDGPPIHRQCSIAADLQD